MQKWLILPLGVLLSSGLIATAQIPATQVALMREPVAPLLLLARVVPAQLLPAPVPTARPPELTPGRFTVVLARVDSPDQRLKHLISVQVVQTMFVTESRVPIAKLPNGRLQLDGFTSTSHMNNLLLGPSILGHPGVRVPRSAWVYGVSLRIRVGGDAQTEHRADGWRSLAKMLGTGRDHRL